MNPIKVLIVDDHALFRAGLKALLQTRPDIQVVGEAFDGLQGVAMTRDLKPDLVLIETQMAGVDGIQAIQLIKTGMPDVCVVMLTASEDEKDFNQAIMNGVQGYILKGTNAEQFFCLIEGALAGGVSVSGSMATKMVKQLSHPSLSHLQTKPETKRLSERELQVLHCLREGPTNRQIAEKLLISESTVKKHIHRIFAKLHLNNRSQAAVMAGRTSESISDFR